MSTANAAPDVGAIAEPPPEKFWDRYNRRFEFPLSTVAAIVAHVAVAALLLVVLVHLMNGSSRASGVPVTLVEDLGSDEDGKGAEGAGVSDPGAKASADPWAASVFLLPDAV
jgi:hypothetical protein